MTISQDQKLMTLLKVTEIRHLIAHTSLGELTLMVRKGEKEYVLCLDAVPLKSSIGWLDANEVMDILFPPKVEIPKDPHVSVVNAIVPQEKIDILRQAVKGKQVQPMPVKSKKK